jgi:hypothetical protein
LQSPFTVIGGLEKEMAKTIIRGLPLLPDIDPVARETQNFSYTSNQWCMIDIDSLLWDGNL